MDTLWMAARMLPHRDQALKTLLIEEDREALRDENKEAPETKKATKRNTKLVVKNGNACCINPDEKEKKENALKEQLWSKNKKEHSTIKRSMNESTKLLEHMTSPTEKTVRTNEKDNTNRKRAASSTAATGTRRPNTRGAEKQEKTAP